MTMYYCFVLCVYVFLLINSVDDEIEMIDIIEGKTGTRGNPHTDNFVWFGSFDAPVAIE